MKCTPEAMACLRFHPANSARSQLQARQIRRIKASSCHLRRHRAPGCAGYRRRWIHDFLPATADPVPPAASRSMRVHAWETDRSSKRAWLPAGRGEDRCWSRLSTEFRGRSSRLAPEGTKISIASCIDRTSPFRHPCWENVCSRASETIATPPALTFHSNIRRTARKHE